MGHQRDLRIGVVEPLVEGFDAPSDVVVGIRNRVPATCAARRDHGGQRQIGPSVPEEPIELLLLQSGLRGDRGAHGVSVVLVGEHRDRLLGIQLPEDAVVRPLPGHPDVDRLLAAVGHETAIEQGAVGLDGVPDTERVLPKVLLLQFHDGLVERHRKGHGLPAVPYEPSGLVLVGDHLEQPVEGLERNIPGDALPGCMIAVAAALVAVKGRLDDDRDVRLHGRPSPVQNGQYVQTPLNPLVT